MVFTRLTSSNANGEFMYTLDEPGIWFVGATMEPEGESAVRGVFVIPLIEEFPPAEESSAPSMSSAELQKAVNDAKQAAQEAKEAAEHAASSATSSPAFGAILVAIGLFAAFMIAMRRK
jgi:cobalt/nickel transport protein